MNNDSRNIAPGDRVLVFDSLLFKDDKKTPLRATMRKATVVCRYGCRSKAYGIYPDLIDVIFDHRPESVSHGHFTNGVEVICKCGASTSICGCISRGTGRLDDYGFWQFPCVRGNDFTPYDNNCSYHGHVKKTSQRTRESFEICGVELKQTIPKYLYYAINHSRRSISGTVPITN